MKKLKLLALCLFTGLFASCNTTKEIPMDLTAAQIIQKGQNSFSISDYKNAINYYETAILRYGHNTDVYIEAKYEIGHSNIQLKNYKEAYDAFSEILELYNYSYGGDLPPSYKKLAQIGLSKIPEKKLNEFNQEKD